MIQRKIFLQLKQIIFIIIKFVFKNIMNKKKFGDTTFKKTYC
jgi:hypothetical protein